MFQFTECPPRNHPQAQHDLNNPFILIPKFNGSRGLMLYWGIGAGSPILHRRGLPIRKSSDQGMFGSSPKRIAHLPRPSSVFHAKASSICSNENLLLGPTSPLIALRLRGTSRTTTKTLIYSIVKELKNRLSADKIQLNKKILSVSLSVDPRSYCYFEPFVLFSLNLS